MTSSQGFKRIPQLAAATAAALYTTSDCLACPCNAETHDFHEHSGVLTVCLRLNDFCHVTV